MLFSHFLLKNGHFDDRWFRLFVPLDSCSLPFVVPPALSSIGNLEVSCCTSGFTASGSASSSLSSSGALEEECYASGFTVTVSGSASSTISSSGALEEACCANIFEKHKNNSMKTLS